MEKRFKEFTLYEETMGATTSDSTTPLLGLAVAGKNRTD